VIGKEATGKAVNVTGRGKDPKRLTPANQKGTANLVSRDRCVIEGDQTMAKGGAPRTILSIHWWRDPFEHLNERYAYFVEKRKDLANSRLRKNGFHQIQSRKKR